MTAEMDAILDKPALRRNIHLATQNRLNVILQTSIVKLQHPEHIPVIGDCQRRHAEFLSLFHQRGNSCSPVQYRILSMNMKVSKLHLATLNSLLCLCCFHVLQSFGLLQRDLLSNLLIVTKNSCKDNKNNRNSRYND